MLSTPPPRTSQVTRHVRLLISSCSFLIYLWTSCVFTDQFRKAGLSKPTEGRQERKPLMTKSAKTLIHRILPKWGPCRKALFKMTASSR
ncbi:hypothetical protein BJX96DRAFT_153063 [Aspergillus floccosus]